MGDLKTSETFQDSVYIYVTASGVAAIGQTPTCTFVKIADNTRTAGTVQEVGSGWYRVTDFTNDAAGTWATEWKIAGSYTIAYPFKIFKVGGGDTATILTNTTNIETKVDTMDAFHDIPAQNSSDNSQMSDVIGNKTDDPTWFTDDVSSLMKFSKAAVSSGGGLSYSGKCDSGMGASTTTIVCDDLKGFGDDFFNTDWVMTINLNDNNHGVSPEGDAPRDITDYVSATGTFTVTAFGANVEENDKLIVQKRGLHTTDAIGIKTTPATNSLAYKLSRFVADGDGDFATGTALPSNKSLYDTIVLDRLDNGTYGLSAIETLVDGIETRTNNHLNTCTYFSASQEEVALTAGAGDKALPSVVLPNISGTIVHAYAGFKFRMLEDTSGGANKLNGAQDIQVKENAAGAYIDAINFVDDQFSIAADTREGGDCIIGNIDVVAQVSAFNKTYAFQWDEGVADAANLQFNDVQTFLIVRYY
jgi:hypothetical protein